MTYSKPARKAARRIPRILVTGLLIVIVAIAAALGYQLPASSSSPAVSLSDVLRSEHRGAPGEVDGAIPDVVTVFDDEIPDVANLDPHLLQALREAATDAATTASSSPSTAAGVRRSIRNNYFVRRSRSTAQKRKLPDGWPPLTRLLTCRGTRSISGPLLPLRGCPSTAPSTGCARSTKTNPGTTNCAPKPSLTAALACTRTLLTTQGCSSDQLARHIPAQIRRPATAHAADGPRGYRQEHGDRTSADPFPDHGSSQGRWLRARRQIRHRGLLLQSLVDGILQRPQAATAASGSVGGEEVFVRQKIQQLLDRAVDALEPQIPS
jgi:hypothetical protein